jgi:hypothetical protein
MKLSKLNEWLTLTKSNMITDKLTRWLTLLANLAVLAGIILVAIQIQQNTDITKAQMAVLTR